MNGISENEFYDFSKALNNRIAYYIEMKKQNDTEEIDKTLSEIDFYVCELIDTSNGNINVEEESTKESFKKLYETACSIKNQMNRISHAKLGLKSTRQDNDVPQSTNILEISNLLLEKSLINMLMLTNEINNNKSHSKK